MSLVYTTGRATMEQSSNICRALVMNDLPCRIIPPLGNTLNTIEILVGIKLVINS